MLTRTRAGTTGRPKGVVLTHANLHVQSLAKMACVGYNSRDVYLHVAPLFHVGGLSSLMAMLMAGARHVVMPRFEAREALALIASRGVTALIAVPAMVQDLAKAAAAVVGETSCASVLRVLVGAGGTTPKMQVIQDLILFLIFLLSLSSISLPFHRQRALRQLFPNAALYAAYGMSEACSSLTFRTLHQVRRVAA